MLEIIYKKKNSKRNIVIHNIIYPDAGVRKEVLPETGSLICVGHHFDADLNVM